MPKATLLLFPLFLFYCYLPHLHAPCNSPTEIPCLEFCWALYLKRRARSLISIKLFRGAAALFNLELSYLAARAHKSRLVYNAQRGNIGRRIRVRRNNGTGRYVSVSVSARVDNKNLSRREKCMDFPEPPKVSSRPNKFSARHCFSG